MLVLAADGLDPVDLDDYATERFVCERWAVGPPEVRKVVEPRTLANGTTDWTRYVGARAVTLTVVALAHPDRALSVQGQIDRLAAFCRPELRPTLTWQVDADTPRQVTMRANPGLDVEWESKDGDALTWRRCGLSFVVPDGLIWAEDTATRLVYPSLGTEEGRRYDEAEVLTPIIPTNLIGSDDRASIEAGATTPGTLVAGWGTWAGNQQVARDPALATHGTSSLKGTRSDGLAGAVQAAAKTSGGAVEYLPLLPEHVYTVLGSFRTTGAADLSSATQFGLGVRNTGATTQDSSMAYPAVAGVWADRVFSIAAPPDAQDVYVLLTAFINAGGQANFDRLAMFDQGAYVWPGAGLLSDVQADIETGPTTPAASIPGWVGGPPTLVSRSTEQARRGASSLKVTWNGGATGNASVNLADNAGVATGVPVDPTKRYRVSASVWTAVAGLIRLRAESISSGGAVISGQGLDSVIILVPAGAWTTLLLDVYPYAAATQLRPHLVMTNMAPGAAFYADELSVTEAPAAPAFLLPSEGGGGLPTGVWGRRYDRVYPASSPVHALITNPGAVAVPWLARIYGPCTNPRLYNDTTGEGLLLTANGGLTLAAGQYAELDAAARTITVGGSSRYDRLDVAASDWWALVPGDNVIRLQPDLFSAGCVAEVDWRPAWL